MLELDEEVVVEGKVVEVELVVGDKVEDVIVVDPV